MVRIFPPFARHAAPRGRHSMTTMSAGAGKHASVACLLESLTVREKVGQITQLETSEIFASDAAAADGSMNLDSEAAKVYAAAGIGSFLNSPTAGATSGKLVVPTAEQWRGFVGNLMQVYEEQGKIPPVMGIDSVHGTNYVREAVLFPHQLNLAASFSRPACHAVGRATAEQSRNAGLPWVFGPLFDVSMNPRFPRVYETFGEDPRVVTALGVAMMQGMQGQDLDSMYTGLLERSEIGVRAGFDKSEGSDGSWEVVGAESSDSSRDTSLSPRAKKDKSQVEECSACTIPEDLSGTEVVAACMKHFFAYQASRSGYDRAPVWVSELQAREYFLPPFEAAIRAGVATAMVAYNSVDGLPIVISRKWTHTWLRKAQQFHGLLVTDWQEVYNQEDWHHTASTGSEAVAQSFLRSSIDMAMVPFKDDFVEEMEFLLDQQVISKARLNEAALRVLELKHRLGLLSGFVEGAPSAAPVSSIKPLGDETVAEHHALAWSTAREGITLVSNTGGVLPLQNITTRDVIAVVGPNATSRAHLLGGWSVHWQGPSNDSEVPDVPTIAEAFEDTQGLIVSDRGVDVAGRAVHDSAMEAAKQATRAIVFAYGEGTYAEIFGDITSAALPQGQLEMLRDLKNIAMERGIPLIGVYIGGRDRLLAAFDKLLDAHLIAFYPGPYGGSAIVDIVTGTCNPSARLPITLHLDDTQNMPYWHTHSDYTAIPVKGQGGRKQVAPLYPFGHGLSYTTFVFSNLQIGVVPMSTFPEKPAQKSASHEFPVIINPHDQIIVTVTVSNTGSIAGKLPVLVFVADEFRIVPPEMKMLKAFQHVSIAANSSTSATFVLGMDDLAFETNDDVMDKPGRMVQPGTFRIEVGPLVGVLKLQGNPLDENDWVRLTTYS